MKKQNKNKRNNNNRKGNNNHNHKYKSNNNSSFKPAPKPQKVNQVHELTLPTSKRGFPCAYEEGGSYTNTGSATIICDKFGGKKQALYIKRKGSLSNSEHALIPIRKGDFLIKVSHHRKDFTIRVLQFDSYTKQSDDTCIGKFNELFMFDNNEWDRYPFRSLEEVINIAKDKATTYHCRSAIYTIEPSRQ